MARRAANSARHTLDSKVSGILPDNVSAIHKNKGGCFRIVAELSPDTILVHQQGTILYINKAGMRLLGEKNRSNIIGKNLMTYVHPEAREKVARQLAEHESNGKTMRFVKQDLRLANGTNLNAEVFSTPGIFEGKQGRHVIVRNLAERKKLEEDIAYSEHKFKTLFEHAGDGIIYVDKTGTVVDANSEMERIFGYSRQELVGKHFTDLPIVRFEDLPRASEIFETLNAGGPPMRLLEFELIDKDGNQVWTETSTRSVKRNGGIDGILAIIRNVTERKLAEKGIRTASRLWQTTFDSLADLVSVNSRDCTFLRVNKAFCQVFNVTAEDVIGKKCHQVVHGKDACVLKCPHATVLKTKQPAVSEMFDPIIGKQIEISASPMFDSQGEVSGSTHIIKDITRRKNVEHKLRESEELHRTLIESSSDCICSLDLDGNFLYMSPVGLASHAMSSVAEVKGKHCTELAEPPYHGLLKRKLKEAKKGKPVRFQYESQTSAGVKWFESTLTLIKDDSGNTLRFLRISRDITSSKTAETKLKQTVERLEKTFEATISSLTSMIEKRDPYTAGHQQRVSKLAATIAKEMGLSENQVAALRVAALVHDIGKINIPAEILSKPGELTDTELKIIQTHPEISYEILKPFTFPWAVADIVLQHHERINGSGYPNALSGDEIVPEARILAVADVVEAMSSHRPYRPAHGLDKALREIESNAGTLYDPEVVQACLASIKKSGLKT